MRNECLTAYSLHQRSFQDKRSIYYLLTKEYGIVHGVAKKGTPQFAPLSLFATGKKSLKTFQQVTITNNVPHLMGTHQYAALYINEITLRLLPLEDSVPYVYDHYHHVIHQLQQVLTNEALRMALRLYEQALFEELGISIDLMFDANQQMIDEQEYYTFSPSVGWTLIDDEMISKKRSGKVGLKNTIPYNHIGPLDNIVLGSHIISMRVGINSQTLMYWAPLHKQLIDFLFDFQPLQSRILWQQYHRYQ